MRRLLLFFLLLIGPGAAAQSGDKDKCPFFRNYIYKGLKSLQKGNYKAAIDAYNVAMLHCPDSAEVARKKILEVFEAIERLHKEAEKKKTLAFRALDGAMSEKQQADEQLKKAKKAEVTALESDNRAQEALKKANKLIQAFYFYDGKYALAFGQRDSRNVFYFIDPLGNEVEHLGRWEKAEQFDWRGFAKVKKAKDAENFEPVKYIDYLLDTTGNSYRVVYSLENFNKKEITALDFSEQNLTDITDAFRTGIWKISKQDRREMFKEFQQQQQQQQQLQQQQQQQQQEIIDSLREQNERQKWLNLIFSSSQIEILLINNNRLKSLPNQIGNLKNLTCLNLHNNRLDSLPAQIGELKNLTSLDLRSNQLSSLPAQIGELKNLTSLDLNDNQLTSLPPQIGELKNLTQLDLRGNSISESEKEKIRSWLPGCNTIFNENAQGEK